MICTLWRLVPRLRSRLEEYLTKHREQMAASPCFPYADYDIRALTPERRAELVAACVRGTAYITGGHSAEQAGKGGTPRTANE